MIGYIRGKIIEINAVSGEVIVDAGQSGVGYSLFLTQKNVGTMLVGDEVSLYVSTQVKEDAITLYGFTTMDERTLFLELIKLNKVGPKLALAILNIYSPAELQNEVWANNEAALKAVPGIGKQLAAKLLIDLTKTLEQFQFSDKLTAGGERHVHASPMQSHSDTRQALAYLGYSEAVIDNVIRLLEESGEELAVEEEVRWCLKHI